jgi:hypothetical protein
MTKLMPPKQQEALLQVPPSQKETQGAEGTLRFHVRPRTNSESLAVLCELSGVLH